VRGVVCEIGSVKCGAGDEKERGECSGVRRAEEKSSRSCEIHRVSEAHPQSLGTEEDVWVQSGRCSVV